MNEDDDLSTTSGLINSILAGSSTYTYPSSSLTGSLNNSGTINITSGLGGGYSNSTYNTNYWNNQTITATASPYVNATYNYGNYPTATTISTPLYVGGDAKFEGELYVKGVSLTERLDKIEERLAILRPNAALEERWDELKAIGDKYRELEKELTEKEAIWELLRK